jgi:hypothetical protein
VTDAAIISDSGAKKIISFDLKRLKSSTLIDSQLGNVVDMEYGNSVVGIFLHSKRKNCIFQIRQGGIFTGVTLIGESLKPIALLQVLGLSWSVTSMGTTRTALPSRLRGKNNTNIANINICNYTPLEQIDVCRHKWRTPQTH